MPLLLQVPGVGLVSAMTLLSAMGDVRRFPDVKHLVGYAGLGAGVHGSGQTHRTGSITKQGRRELRTIAGPEPRGVRAPRAGPGRRAFTRAVTAKRRIAF